MSKKENILVSACLMGVHCRYDGKCQNIEKFDEKLPLLMEKYNLIPVCPEVYGGLTTPRKPSEIKGDRVCNCAGEDVTEQFERGANEALLLAQRCDCKKAILKFRSPSCGSGYVYDGTFSKTVIEGDGITARLLKDNDIAVYTELDCEELID